MYMCRDSDTNCSIGKGDGEESARERERYERIVESPVKEGNCHSKIREKQNGGYYPTDRTSPSYTKHLIQKTILTKKHHHPSYYKSPFSSFEPTRTNPLPPSFLSTSHPSYPSEVKKIITYLIDKLLSNKPSKTLRRRSPSSISFLSDSQVDIIKNQQEELLAEQNRTELLVEELGNVKGLWEKAKELREQLVGFGEEMRERGGRVGCNTPYIYSDDEGEEEEIQKGVGKLEQKLKSIDGFICQETDAFNELKDLLEKTHKQQSDKNSHEIKQFQTTICTHLLELKQKIQQIQQNTLQSKQTQTQNHQHQLLQLHNQLSSQRQKTTLLTSKLQTLTQRNLTLESDNIRILEQSQQIHQKLHDTQLFYIEKVSSLQEKVRQQLKSSDTDKSPEHYQSQIRLLREQLVVCEGDKVAMGEEMKMMQGIIQVLENEKQKQTDLIQQLERRENDGQIGNSNIISSLKQKISELEKDRFLMQTGQSWKTQITSMNPSHEESKLEQIQDEEINGLKKIKQQLEEQLQSYKALLSQKEQSTFFQSQLTQPQLASSLLTQLSNHLNLFSLYSPSSKQKLSTFLSTVLSTKSPHLPSLNNLSSHPSIRQNLSSRSLSSSPSPTSQNQPTFMDIFSKFDPRQQSILRLTDLISTHLRSNDLLTQSLHDFLIPLIPPTLSSPSDFAHFQSLAETFIIRIKEYQAQRILTVDKLLSEYIIGTHAVFKGKEEIEAVLDESSEDEDSVGDKFLWEDILGLGEKVEKEEVKVVNRKARVALKRVMTINRKYSGKRGEEGLEVIPEEEGKGNGKGRKNRSVLFSDEGGERLEREEEEEGWKTPVKRRTRND